MTETMEERPYKLCDLCGQVDKAPRHLHYGSVGEFPISPEVAAYAVENRPKDFSMEDLMAELQDSSSQQAHLDCCMQNNCPDGSCNVIHDRTPAPEDKPLQNAKLFQFIKDDKNAVGQIGTDLNEARYAAAEAERSVLEGSEE